MRATAHPSGAWLVVLAAFVSLLAYPASVLAQQPPSGAEEDPGAAVELLMDSSGSMAADDGSGTRKIDAAKDAVNGLVSALPKDTKVGLRVFGGRLPNEDKARGCRDTRVIFPVAAQDPAAVKAKVESYKPTGFTPIALSLERAADDLPRTGKRTIVLVSDGQDTCQPPSPCAVAAKVARRGVDIKIEAVGFRVNQKTRRQLRCIARVGRGTYHDADNAEDLGQELRAISTRAVRTYKPEGKPVRCGPTVRTATEIGPGQYVDRMRPQSRCYYKVKLAKGETLTAALSLVTPKRGVGAIGSSIGLSILNPVFKEQTSPGQVSDANLFSGAGDESTESLGLYGQPAGLQGDNSVEFARDDEFGRTGDYYLKVEFSDSNDRELRDESDDEPFALELLVDVLGRKSVTDQPSGSKASGGDGQAVVAAAASEDDGSGSPSGLVALIVGVAAGVLGLAGGAALIGRRRRAV